MNASDIRAMSVDELHVKVEETHKAIFNMRFQAAAGQLEDYNRIRAMRRDLARMKTILRERELAAQASVAQGGEK